MGLRIDSARASLEALVASRATPVPVTQPRDTPLRRAQGLTEPVPLEPGFGENSINLASASITTIGTNLRRSREAVPSAEELREEVRERFREENTRAAAREAAAGDRVEFSGPRGAEALPPAEEASPATAQPVRPEATPRAREFEAATPPPGNAETRLDVSV